MAELGRKWSTLLYSLNNRIKKKEGPRWKKWTVSGRWHQMAFSVLQDLDLCEKGIHITLRETLIVGFKNQINAAELLLPASRQFNPTNAHHV